MDSFPRISNKREESFCTLSFAFRLLSKMVVNKTDIAAASELIDLFFTDFKQLYGEEMQSYNFNSMRHLCDQVRRAGPL